MHGFQHPLGGLDHLAAMVAVGLWAGIAGGRRVWVWPLAFVAMMVVGGLLGRAGVALPMVEPVIALSVVVLGVLVAATIRVPVALGAVIVAVFAIFHGHAHGAEAPETGWLGYAAGFVVATALLHAVGIAIARLLERGVGPRSGPRARRRDRRARRFPAREVRAAMIPGEVFPADGEIELNAGRAAVTITVANTGDRPIQVGSHYHFYETNPALKFDREKARGCRLDIAAGTAVRFEPGQTRDVQLVAVSGARTIYGFRQEIMGKV